MKNHRIAKFVTSRPRTVAIEPLERRALLSAAIAVVGGDAALSIYPGQAIHVNGLNSTVSSVGDKLNTRYLWNFGDVTAAARPGPGVGGTTGNHNVLDGFNAAHVYDQPGDYQLSLTVTDSSGGATPLGFVPTASVTVHVKPETRPTYFVSSGGTGDGSSAGSPAAVDRLEADLRAGLSGRRVLFKRGDTFMFDADRATPAYDPIVLSGANDDIDFGTFGDPAAADPRLRWVSLTEAQWQLAHTDFDAFKRLGTENNFILTTGQGADRVTVRGLTFGRPYDTNPNHPDYLRQATSSAIRPGGTNLVVRDVEFQNVANAINTNTFTADGLLLLDSAAREQTDLRTYMVWAETKNTSILGNYAVNSTGEHIVRASASNGEVDAWNGLNISYNRFANEDNTAIGFAGDQIKTTVNLQRGQNAYVAHNELSTGMVTAGPLGGGDGREGDRDRTDWVVFEANRVRDAAIQVLAGARHVAVRNNLLDSPAAAAAGASTTYTPIEVRGFDASSNSSGVVYNRGTKDVRVLYNTVVMRNRDNQRGITVGSVPADRPYWTGHQIVGNLVGSPQPLSYYQRSLVIEGGLNSVSNIGYNTFTSSPPTNGAVVDAGGRGFSDADAWNGVLRSQGKNVGTGDVFSSTQVAADGTPAAPAPNNGQPYPGVFGDRLGNPRPANSPWTSGAAQVGAVTPVIPRITLTGDTYVRAADVAPHGGETRLRVEYDKDGGLYTRDALAGFALTNASADRYTLVLHGGIKGLLAPATNAATTIDTTVGTTLSDRTTLTDPALAKTPTAFADASATLARSDPALPIATALQLRSASTLVAGVGETVTAIDTGPVRDPLTPLDPIGPVDPVPPTPPLPPATPGFPSQIRVAVYEDTGGFDEATATWSSENPRPAGVPLDIVTVSFEGDYRWDVTKAVKARLNAGGTGSVAFRLVALDDIGGAGINFDSREKSAATGPKLIAESRGQGTVVNVDLNGNEFAPRNPPLYTGAAAGPGAGTFFNNAYVPSSNEEEGRFDGFNWTNLKADDGITPTGLSISAPPVTGNVHKIPFGYYNRDPNSPSRAFNAANALDLMVDYYANPDYTTQAFATLGGLTPGMPVTLYLYGAGSQASEGVAFTVTGANGVKSTAATAGPSASTDDLTYGEDYVVLPDLLPDAGGKLTIAFANSVGGEFSAFNGLQAVFGQTRIVSH